MDTVLTQLFKQKVLSILRLQDSQLAGNILDLCIEVGLNTNEITLTTPDALNLIKARKIRCGSAVSLGVGTVLTCEQCHAARDHGADFIVTPNLNLAVVRECVNLSLPIIPGCFTPSEMQLAHEEGATAVKLFPVSSLNASFIKAVLAPLPHLRIIAVGGVNLTNAKSYITAGAAAVGVGTQIFGDVAISSPAGSESMRQTVRQIIDNLI